MRKLDSFKFKGKHGSSRYPWQEWLDGGIYELVRGEDFQTTAASLRGTAVAAAYRRGLKLRTSIRGNAVTIQAYTSDGS
jgi:hypothetical protein